MSDTTITEVKALLREVTDGTTTPSEVVWAVGIACGVTLTADDVADAAESLRIVEADDYADSDGYDEDARYSSRDGRHEACLAAHEDNLEHHLGRITGRATPTPTGPR